MGKQEQDLENLENPFKQFSVLRGEFTESKEEDKVDDTIETGTTTIVKGKDEEVVEVDDAEAAKLAAAEKALEKVVAKQAKAVKKEDGEDTTTSKKPGPKELSDEDDEDEEELEGKSEGFREFTKDLYNKGILDFDDTDKDFEDSEDGIGKLVEKTSEKRAQDRINKWVQELPEDGVEFLEYIKNGGKPKEFLDTYYGNTSWKDLKIEDDNTRKQVIEASLKLSGESDEDIKDMLSEWEINGSLEKRANSALGKLQKYETTQKEQMLKAQKERAEQEKAEQAEYWDSFKKNLFDKEDISGFKLTPKVKEDLWNFMTTVDRKTGKTPYQEAIEQNKDSSYLFAYLAMNKFDSKKLERQVESKAASKLAGVLKNYKDSSKMKISSGSSEEPSEDNPFGAFKTLR